MKKRFQLVHRITNQILPIPEIFSKWQDAATFAVACDLHANVREISTGQEWERDFSHPDDYIA